MKSKKLLFVFVLMICFSNYTSAQTTGSKLDKTAKDLKKAEEVVDKTTKLSKLFKKKDKKKPEPQSEVSKDSLLNSTAESSNIELTEDVSLANNSPGSTTNVEEVQLTNEAELLFKNVISKTTNAEKNEIAAGMNIKGSADKTQFYIDDQYSSEYLLNPDVYPLDINNDGDEEIVIVYGHPAITGDNVISTLFIKDTQGHYISNFSFTGSLIILPNTTKDFPDLAIGGPGFEFPVWRWNGKTYDYNRKITDNKLMDAKPLFIAEGSKLYTETIKSN